MYDLSRFSLTDMIRCSTDLRMLDRGSSSMEDVAGRTVTYLRDRLIDPRTRQPACALVRLYKTHPFSQLEPQLRDAARAAAGEDASADRVACLTLLATAGDEPEWNDRHLSIGHRAIPLHTVQALERLPMVEALVEQLGLAKHEVVAPNPAMFVELDQRSYNVFYVAEAVGSPLIPAQDFVENYGIRSVLGFGGVLPKTGSVFAVVLFTKTQISRETAGLFRSIALSVKLALMRFVDGPVFAGDKVSNSVEDESDPAILSSTVASLDELLSVRESVVVEQTERLERAVLQAEQRASEAARARRERAETEDRKAAIVDTALDAIITMDDDGLIVEFNPAASGVFGYTHDEAVGQPMAELLIPRDLRDRHRAGLEEYKRTGRPRVIGRRVQLKGQRKDRSLFPLELTITDVHTGGTHFYTGHIRDITDRVEGEQAVRDSRERAARIAKTLQDSLLPPELPRLPGLELAARYRPAGDGTEVGGDFYDVFEIARDDWCVLVGDVCGKGTEAAALTALVRYSVRAAAIRFRQPRAILRVVNEAILRQRSERFCTLILARLRRRDGSWRMKLASAGHPLALVSSAGSEPVELGGKGRLLGVFADIEFKDVGHHMQPGQSVVFYTDGLPDSMHKADWKGEERMLEVVRRHGSSDAAELSDALLAAALSAEDGRTRDDVALVVIRNPASSD